MQTSQDDIYDAIVLGGGPAGAAAALRLRQLGRRVVVVEKEAFPRFHVGESLIPQDMDCFAKLGVLERMNALPRAHKRGVEFALGDNARGSRIWFADALAKRADQPDETFNVERAVFDHALLDAAAEAGAEVMNGWKVDAIEHLTDDEVRIRVAPVGKAGGPPRTLRGRCVFDASGQSTLIGRHRRTRANFDAPRFQKIAYFGHFEHVNRDNPLGEDCISMVLCDEGWFWMIPIDERRVSIGMVLDAAVARHVKLPSHQMLRWGIERCPLIRDRLGGATWPQKNGSISDYSYSCAPYAGPGYYLVGDAATFLDPVFSTGLYLGMEGAIRAAECLDQTLKGGCTAAQARQRYTRFLRGGVARFFKLIQAFYDPAFRDFFLEGTGPLQMHRALISVLAGQVFPRPAWPVRWRLRLFYACVALQKRVQLTPRRPGFSLLAQAEPAAAPNRVTTVSPSVAPAPMAVSA